MSYKVLSVFSMSNYPEGMFCYMAITSIGSIVVPLNSWWQGDELEYGITNSESKLFIGDEERLGRLGDRCSDVAKISVRSNNPDHQAFDFYKVIEGASDKLENPVEILPAWLQLIAKFLPLVHLFEEMRNILIEDIVNYYAVLKACIISLIYLVAGIIIFFWSYNGAKVRGTLINMGE